MPEAMKTFCLLPYNVLTDHDVAEGVDFNDEAALEKVANQLNQARDSAKAAIDRWVRTGWDIGAPGVTLRPDGVFCFRVRLLNGTVRDWDWDDPGRAVVRALRLPVAFLRASAKDAGYTHFHDATFRDNYDFTTDGRNIALAKIRAAAADYEGNPRGNNNNNNDDDNDDAGAPLIETFNDIDADLEIATFSFCAARPADLPWLEHDRASGTWRIDETFSKRSRKK